MKLVLVWPGRRNKAVPEADDSKFWNALQAAIGGARFYKGYEELPASRGEASPSETLALLPKVEMLDYLIHPERFELTSPEPHGHKPCRRIKFPATKPKRTAVLCKGYREDSGIRIFEDFRSPRLTRWEPECIVGPVDTLRSLAQQIIFGTLTIPALQHSVIVYTGLLEGPLSQDDRDLFWEAFHVPVFEQFRGFNGEVLAWECEAHDGLHINPKTAVFEVDRQERLLVSFLDNPNRPAMRMTTGLTAKLINTPCGCAQKGYKLLDLDRQLVRIQPKPIRAALPPSSAAAAG